MLNTEGVFESYKEDESDLGGLFTRLKNLLISENHTKWDIAYLESYVKLGMVPRSLRWEVPPQKGDTDLEEWFKYFNLAGVSFLQFLIKRKVGKLARLDEEIKGIKTKLDPSREGEDYKDKSLNLLKLLEKDDKEQRTKKKKKFNRDLEDYHGNVVFTWQKKLLEEQARTVSNEMEVGNVLVDSVNPNNQSHGPSGPRSSSQRGRPVGPQARNSPRRGSGAYRFTAGQFWLWPPPQFKDQHSGFCAQVFRTRSTWEGLGPSPHSG